MKVKVYVNWEEQAICSEKESEGTIADYTADLMEDAFSADSDNIFYYALRAEGIAPEDYASVFSLTEENKAAIREKVMQACREEAHNRFEEDYCEYEFEV